jgi:hypothetical protein
MTTNYKRLRGSSGSAPADTLRTNTISATDPAGHQEQAPAEIGEMLPFMTIKKSFILPTAIVD